MSPAAKGKKGKKKGKDDKVLADPAQVRRERVTLTLMLLGIPVIVLGMIVISTFLRNGVEGVNRWVFWTFVVLAAGMAVGIVYQVLTRPAKPAGGKAGKRKA